MPPLRAVLLFFFYFFVVFFSTRLPFGDVGTASSAAPKRPSRWRRRHSTVSLLISITVFTPADSTAAAHAVRGRTPPPPPVPPERFRRNISERPFRNSTQPRRTQQKKMKDFFFKSFFKRHRVIRTAWCVCVFLLLLLLLLLLILFFF